MRLFSVVALVTGVLGGIGPQALYNLLNGQTFNPPGYTIVMYQSCMQNQNAGNPCGSFSTFESSNGVYTYQRYGPEAPVSPSCSRTFLLTMACGATLSMSGVNENPTCVYSATLTLPQACGIDMRVGNEAASVSGTAAPPTPSITRSVTATGTQTRTISISSSNAPTVSITLSDTSTPSITYTGSGTSSMSGTQTGTLTTSLVPTSSVTITNTATGTLSSSLVPTATVTSTSTVSMIPTATVTGTTTPLFEITMYPSRSTTPSIPVTTTPLYMITAWPTVSPVNVSATSSPLFMYSAYPSVSTNVSGGGGSSFAEALGITPGSQTATILGGVAVGVLGIVLVVGTVIYFKNGGSVSGLVQKVKDNKGLITKAASMLPLTEEQKAKVDAAVNDPTSLLPEQAQQVIQRAKEYPAQAIASLPISEEQKAQLTTVVSSVHDKVVKKMEPTPTSPTKQVKPAKQITTSVSENESKPKQVMVTEPKQVMVPEPKQVMVTEPETESEQDAVAVPTLVSLHISEADIEAVKAFLAEKEISHV